MTVEQLEGIANVDFSTATLETLTWETATDWDNAVSEQSVVHESYGDLPGDDVVQLGYRSSRSDLEALISMDDSSGPLTDVTGNGHDMSINGVTMGVTGIADTTAASASSGDVGEMPGDPEYSIIDNYTIFFWFKTTDTSGMVTEKRDTDGSASGTYQRARKWRVANDSGNVQFLIEDNNSASASYTGPSMNDGNWHSIAMKEVVDGSDNADYYGYFDGSIVNGGSPMFSTSSPPNTDESITFWHRRKDDGADDSYTSGDLDAFHLFLAPLSDGTVTELHNAGVQGNLVSATKSFSSDRKPNLENLSYNLNGETINLTVIGSPGTASEETVTQTLDGGTSYTLTWSNSHTDFRVKPEFSTSSVTNTPNFSRVELVG